MRFALGIWRRRRQMVLNVRGREDGMTVGKRTIVIGVAGSILLHAACALAIVVLVTGHVPGFSGSAGDIFMVSYVDGGASSRANGGSPAFSAQRVAVAPRLKIASPQRLKGIAHDIAPRSSGMAVSGIGAEISKGTGGGASGRLLAIEAPKPLYPPAARRAGFEGRALLEVEIAPVGAVSSVTILESSGREDCDLSARSTIMDRWRFAPLGASSPMRQNIAIRFALK